MIAPFALLVPVSGMLSSTVLLGEPRRGWKIHAAILVLARYERKGRGVTC